MLYTNKQNKLINNSLEILQIKWEQTISIRHEVLWPNKNIEFCHVNGDKDALHFGAFMDTKIICVASIFIDGKHARLRKFATLKKYQNRGIGSKVLNFILDTLKKKGITYFWCDARKSSIDFYKNFGLKPEGVEFYKSDIPYYKMYRYL